MSRWRNQTCLIENLLPPVGGKVKLFHFDSNKLTRNWKKTLPNVVYCSRFQPVQRSQCLAAPHRKPKERTDNETENKQVLQAWQRTAENSLNPAQLGSLLLQLQLFCWWWWREIFLPSCRGEKHEFTALERLPPLALECSRYRVPVCRGKGEGPRRSHQSVFSLCQTKKVCERPKLTASTFASTPPPLGSTYLSASPAVTWPSCQWGGRRW